MIVMNKNGGYIETRITRKGDHYEVYADGEFICSADTMTEAVQELESYLGERRKFEEIAV